MTGTRIMGRLLARLIPRDTLIDRGSQHPLTLMVLLLITIAQVVIYVLEFSRIGMGRMLAFDPANPEIQQLFFFLTHYAPVSNGAEGAGFVPLDFAASLLHFMVCAFCLLACGPTVESYLGTRKTFACFLFVIAAHALVGAAIPLATQVEHASQPAVFGTLGFASFLLTMSVLIALESRDEKLEADNDLRVALLVLCFVIAGSFAGFMKHASYDTLVAAVAVGPAGALMAFVANRRLQMRKVVRQGAGQVGKLYFVEEVDLLTKEEIQTRMDRLLEKISSGGLDSLSGEERRFMAKASGRLKTQEHGQDR